MKSITVVVLSIASSLSIMLPAVAGMSGGDLKTAKQAIENKDYSTALPILQDAAKSGNPEAQRMLGELYESGCGVPKDAKMAGDLYDRAALAQASSNDTDLMWLHGKKVAKNLKLAVPALEAAAKNGDVEALNKLGFAYQHGIDVKEDWAKSSELYQQAVDKGDADAMNNLAFMLIKGEDGNDSARALKLFTDAADRGNAHAVANLGWMYLHGIGVPKSPEKALEYFRKAAAKGIPAARLNLGMMYEKGICVSRDLAKSDKLFQLAASSASVAADDDLEFVHSTGTIAEKGHGAKSLNAVLKNPEPQGKSKPGETSTPTSDMVAKNADK
jgi:hypothetical protein